MLFAMARGAWIVDKKWVLESLDRGYWLPEEAYENHYYKVPNPPIIS